MRRRPIQCALALIGGASLLIAADDPLGPAAPLQSKDVLAGPSDAVRSASLAFATPEIREPVTVALLCMAFSDGQISDCVPDGTELARKADWKEFMRVAGTDAADRIDNSAFGIARLRVRQMLLRPREGKRAYLVRISETIAPADRRALRPAVRTLKPADLRFSYFPPPELISNLYPLAALRRETRTRVTVRCRIEADHALFCYSGEAGSGLTPSDAQDFILATYQVLSHAKAEASTPGGEPTAGADVTLSMNWAL